MEQHECLLQFKDICVGTQNVTIDHHVSLDVYPAEIVGIIGESGCGKSTLLKSVLSLNNDTVRPLSGEILFRGQDVLQYGAADLRSISGREIAVIFQSLSMAFDPITKIGKQFFEAVKYHRKTANKKETDEKAAMLLRELKFDDPKRILNAYPFELSGGMVQRAAIVAAMLNEPALILADEATSALDAVSQEQVIETLLHIREKYATAVLFITHNMHVVEKLADTVAVMYGGRIVEKGKAADVLNNPKHPYTIALIAAVPKANGTMPEGIAGSPPPFERVMDYCPYHMRCPYAQTQCRESFPCETETAPGHFVFCYRMDD